MIPPAYRLPIIPLRLPLRKPADNRRAADKMLAAADQLESLEGQLVEIDRDVSGIF